MTWCEARAGMGGEFSTQESNDAYFGLKVSLAFSPGWNGQKRHNATIPIFCSLLERLREGFGRRSRGFGVTGVDVGQGAIKRAVPEMLANQEGIRALLDHQHSGGVLQK